MSDFELGGWAVIHVGGDLIQDGFDSERAAYQWIEDNEDMLEDPTDHYEVVEVEDDWGSDDDDDDFYDDDDGDEW